MAGEAEKKATAVKDKANGTNPKSTAEKSGESRTNGTDNNKSEGKKVGKTPSVRFSPDTKPASKRRPKPSTPPRSVKRSYIGKANLKRDIPIFLGIMAFLLWVAISTANVGKPKPKNKKGLKNMKKELSNIAKAYQKDMEGRRRSTECGIFLGSSSIPSAGISWFAGKLFQEGDVVVSFWGARFTVFLRVRHAHPFYPA